MSNLLLNRLLTSTPVLYVFAIVIWGSTWYGIKLQLGVVAPELSIAYRFILAGLLLFLWLGKTKRSLRFSKQDHLRFLILGVCLFSLSYILAYYAGGLIPSGMNAILFSAIMIFNVFNARLFFKTTISWITLLGALISLGGLCLVFLPQVLSLDPSSVTQMTGMGFSLFGALLGSFGNMISSTLSKKGIGVMPANAFAMLYGGIASLLFAFFMGKPLVFDTSFSYVGSLIYLAIFGSVITFGCYLTILSRVGPEKAALPMVGIPIVALFISELFEDYHWSDYALLGIALILIGNLIAVAKGKQALFQKLKQKLAQKNSL